MSIWMYTHFVLHLESIPRYLCVLKSTAMPLTQLMGALSSLRHISHVVRGMPKERNNNYAWKQRKAAYLINSLDKLCIPLQFS